MNEENENNLVVPVVSEEAHADAIPVETGGVRVVKRVEGHEEILEQELRKGRVEVKRVKVNRVVDGPQAAQRRGSTLIVPVVSEVLRVTKEWVVTEEIHITQTEELETVQQRVQVNNEVADIERFDDQGRVTRDRADVESRPAAASVLGKEGPLARKAAAAASSANSTSRKILNKDSSLLRNRSDS